MAAVKRWMLLLIVIIVLAALIFWPRQAEPSAVAMVGDPAAQPL